MSSTPRNTFQTAILRALQSGHHVYAGTVSAKDKAARRAANKVARVSRRRNRSAR